MLIPLASIFGKPILAPYVALELQNSCRFTTRANRAQFSEVPMRTFVEEDMMDVALPTVQGLDDGESESSFPLVSGVGVPLICSLFPLSALWTDSASAMGGYSAVYYAGSTF